MGENRGIYSGSGMSAILAGIFVLLCYFFFLAGFKSIGLPPVFKASDILSLHRVFLVKLSINIFPIALVFSILAITGAFVWLWQRSRGLGLAGFILGVLGVLIFSALAFAEIALVRVASGLEPTLLPIKSRLTLVIFALDRFLVTPGVFFIALLFFLWGLAFMEASKESRTVGIVFLLEILFFIATLFLFLFDLRFLAGIGIFVNVILVSLGLILMGVLLLRVSSEEKVA